MWKYHPGDNDLPLVEKAHYGRRLPISPRPAGALIFDCLASRQRKTKRNKMLEGSKNNYKTTPIRSLRRKLRPPEETRQLSESCYFPLKSSAYEMVYMFSRSNSFTLTHFSRSEWEPLEKKLKSNGSPLTHEQHIQFTLKWDGNVVVTVKTRYSIQLILHENTRDTNIQIFLITLIAEDIWYFSYEMSMECEVVVIMLTSIRTNLPAWSITPTFWQNSRLKIFRYQFQPPTSTNKRNHCKRRK